jgi:hypothetical protein
MPSTYRDQITPDARTMLDYVEAKLKGQGPPPTKYVPIGRRPDQPGADLRAHIRQTALGEAPPARTPAPSDDPDSDIREEAFARLSVEQREAAIKRDPAAEAAYRAMHAEVSAEYAAAAAAEEEEYYHSPTGGSMKNARKLWAESRSR